MGCQLRFLGDSQQVADSPEALAEQCDVILAMLADPVAAEKVGQSIAKGIREGEYSPQLSFHAAPQYSA